MTILQGINFTTDSALLPIVVESDAQSVINLINGSTPVSTDIGLVIWDIKDCVSNLPRTSFTFVPRAVNVVAHSLSKFGLTIADDCFSMKSYPPCIERFVRDDHLV
ncbi:hypothetical protein Ddye_006448 [Dipteronia dyeriana]|uniref:RNase H type-1 domain-containing protein n=1 Tax=Dipteronia dyeriana TaxID=168575 RepID=A0AAD9XIE6_9ROSI|nr:hypothetical protein Ddye_006448 [Dipteronia dyeriana]